MCPSDETILTSASAETLKASPLEQAVHREQKTEQRQVFLKAELSAWRLSQCIYGRDYYHSTAGAVVRNNPEQQCGLVDDNTQS